MKRTAEKYLNVLRSWLGYSEVNGKFKEIIDIYNKEGNLPRGYRVSYQDAWCDVTVSAAAIRAGMTDLIGRECGCEEHIKLFKEKGIWIEDGNITPKPGYLIVYNWDVPTQPNDGYADHIGVVEKVCQDTLICIEGNYKDSVTRREIPIGWGYIRGYAAPRYDAEEDTAGKDASDTEAKENGTGNVISDNKTSEKSVLNKKCLWKGTVSVKSSLNVRKWAGTAYGLCSFSPLYNGTEVEICDSICAEDGAVWHYIRYQEKYGFVHADHIRKQTA